MTLGPHSDRPKRLSAPRHGRWGYAFIGPAMALLLLVHVYPLVHVIGLSFSEYGVVEGHARWAGVDNYARLIDSDVFYIALRNTILYTLIVVPVAMLISLGLAYLVHPLGRRMQTFYKSAFYLPGVVSSVVLALVWSWMYSKENGLLNQLLGALYIEPVGWLADSGVALVSIALIAVTSGLGVPLLLLLAAMDAVPDDYYEAAEIDGAGPLRSFWHISVPLLKPTLLYLVVVMTIGSFQVFETVYLMTDGGPSYATTTLVYLIYESAFRYFDFGLASAQAVVLFLMVLVLAIVQFRLLSTDVEY